MAEDIGIILQARMGSSRLPGKVLKPFGHTTLLGWILERLGELPWPVVVATSDLPGDDEIERYCHDTGATCFRGSEQDVLDRYFQCARSYRFGHVVRLTGDNPFPDIGMLRLLAETHLSSKADYTHSFGEMPVGTGAEVFSFKALQRCWEEGWAEHHREHVNEYILDHPSEFRISRVSIPTGKLAPGLRLTIDTEEDYKRVLGCLKDQNDVQISTEALIRRCLYFA